MTNDPPTGSSTVKEPMVGFSPRLSTPFRSQVNASLPGVPVATGAKYGAAELPTIKTRLRDDAVDGVLGRLQQSPAPAGTTLQISHFRHHEETEKPEATYPFEFVTSGWCDSRTARCERISNADGPRNQRRMSSPEIRKVQRVDALPSQRQDVVIAGGVGNPQTTPSLLRRLPDTVRAPVRR